MTTQTTKRACVSYFPPYLSGGDITHDYVGDVIRDNDDWIEILVDGSTMTFPKSRVIVSAA